MTAPCLLAALDYARKGWPVLPIHACRAGRCSCGRADCSSKGKHPRTEHGVKDATTDPDTIREWWRRWPDSNVGVAAGRVSGIWILDVDTPKEGRTVDGWATLAALQAKHGDLPPGPWERTGGGGAHLVYRYPDDRVIPNRAGLLPGLDSRGENGFIVAAPSVHASGSGYTWETYPLPPGGEPPDDGRVWAHVPEAPAWLLEALFPPERPRETPHAPPVGMQGADDRRRALGRRWTLAALDGAALELAAVTEYRHKAIYRAAFRFGGYAAGGWISEAVAWAALVEAGDRAMPEAPREVRATVDDGFRAGAAKPRDPPEPDDPRPQPRHEDPPPPPPDDPGPEDPGPVDPGPAEEASEPPDGGSQEEGRARFEAACSLVADDFEDVCVLVGRRRSGEEAPSPLPWAGANDVLGGGLWPGQSYVLVAEPKAGKTQWCLQAALSAAEAGEEEARRPVLYVDLEVGPCALFCRVAGIMGRCSWSDLYLGRPVLGPGETGRIERLDPDRLLQAAKDRLKRTRFRRLRLSDGLAYTDLRPLVDGMVRCYPDAPPPLVVVDYLQQLRAPEEPRADARERVGQAAYEGHRIARDTGATVLLVSSTARAGYGGGDKVGILGRGDPLRFLGLAKEAGEVEYSADGVLALLREPWPEDETGRAAPPPDRRGSWEWLAVAALRAPPSGEGAARWGGWVPLRFPGWRFDDVPYLEAEEHRAAVVRARAKDAALAAAERFARKWVDDRTDDLARDLGAAGVPRRAGARGKGNAAADRAAGDSEPSDRV